MGSADEKVLLYKDCATTGVIGLLFALSCVVTPRPVLFYFAQRYGTDGTREGMNAFDEMWVVYAGFRRSMYTMNIVWAIIFLVHDRPSRSSCGCGCGCGSNCRSGCCNSVRGRRNDGGSHLVVRGEQ